MTTRSRPLAATAAGHVWVCGRFGQTRAGHPWCQLCGHYLVYDAEYADWTSYAEREYRQIAAQNARRIAAGAGHAQRAAAALRDRVPDGWTLTQAQHLPGAGHTLDVQPPPGPVDAVAYLSPPDGDGAHGWVVRIHNRSRRIDFPLYVPGGVRAARYPTAETALQAAIDALRIERAASTRR